MKEKVELPGWLLLVVVCLVGLVVLAPLYTMLAFNLVLPYFDAPMIDYLQALGIDLIVLPFLALCALNMSVKD